MINVNEITIDLIIDKRKQIWNKHHNIQLDKEFVEAACNELVMNKQLRDELRDNPHKLIEVAFTIVDKEANLVPFFLNKVQKKIENVILTEGGQGTKKPIFILKSRQQGATAYITALQLAFALVKTNFSGYTLADLDKNSMSIFNDKAKAVYDRLPNCIKPTEKYNSKKELFFNKLNNSWRVDVASKETARSKTLSFVHLSEAGFFNVSFGFIEKALFPAITQNGYVIIETTANGFNDIKTLWDSETCVNLFLEWWDSDEYENKSLSCLNNLKDEWIFERVQWLRNKGVSDSKIAWYVDTYNNFRVDPQNSIMQEYPCTAKEAFVSSGMCAFNKFKLIERLDTIIKKKPLRIGDFKYKRSFEPDGTIVISDIEWKDDEFGSIRIYEEPNITRRYVLGGDTAGEGSDFFTAQITDNLTLNQVAVYRQRQSLDLEYASQIYCLGLMYNQALLSIEVNFNVATVNYLEAMKYSNQYVNEKIDTIGTTYTNKYGFRTTKATKPPAITELRQIIEENVNVINDVETINEMLTFEKKGDGIYGAVDGNDYHDDLVMALAIAYATRHQQEIQAPTKEKKKDKSHWMFETNEDEITNEWGDY